MLIDLFWVESVFDHLTCNLMCTRRSSRITKAVGVGHHRYVQTESDLWIKRDEVQLFEKLVQELANATRSDLRDD